MPTDNDMIPLSFVMFNKHVNLGGVTSKHLSGHPGTGCELALHPASGMVRVHKLSGLFWVGATCIESAEQLDATTRFIPRIEDVGSDGMAALYHSEPVKVEAEEALSADTPQKKAEILREKAGKTARGGKAGVSEPPMSRADEILAELSGK